VDVCYDTSHYTDAFPYPAPDYESVAKMKLEGDIFQNYTKYALSASIKVADAVDFTSVADAAHYFNRLNFIQGISNTDVLVVVEEYYAGVFDQIKLKVNGDSVFGALIIRHAKTDLTTPFIVKFSLKIKKPKDGWHYETLVELGQVYYEMLQSDMNLWKGRTEPSAGERKFQYHWKTRATTRDCPYNLPVGAIPCGCPF
jgi:hypothetical protein